MLVAALFSVAAKRMLRAATCLLVVLICTAGLYLLLDYHFMAAVQLSVYAGGILVLFIFAILLTRPSHELEKQQKIRKIIAGAVSALTCAAVVICILLKTNYIYNEHSSTQEISMADIGTTLMGTEKYQYLFAFEILSVLLLICLVGGIVIARKRQ
jgi:NADH-quinone oxidoreductase subunit J